MAEHVCATRHIRSYEPQSPEWALRGPAGNSRDWIPLVVAAVNGAGQPIALACPICRTLYDTDEQLIGKPDTWRPLTDAKDFTGAAGRLIDAGIGEQGEIV